MSNSPSFVQHALELLEQVGPIRARSMFGGHGLSLNGTSIGIIDDDWLYLRVDDETRPQFEAAGSRPFTYVTRKTGEMVMTGYWALPEEAIDDPDLAVRWGRLAADAAARAEARKKAKPTRRRPVTKRPAKQTASAAAKKKKTRTRSAAPRR